MGEVTYPWWDLSPPMLIKGVNGHLLFKKYPRGHPNLNFKNPALHENPDSLHHHKNHASLLRKTGS